MGNGERSVRYLAAYVFYTVISDKRILAMKDGAVIFKYTDTKSGTEKMMKLKPFEFNRHFLQHVLPSVFMKIRYYGFLHPSSSIPLEAAVAILETLYRFKAHRKKKSLEMLYHLIIAVKGMDSNGYKAGILSESM